jgi:hypothetical protein
VATAERWRMKIEPALTAEEWLGVFPTESVDITGLVKAMRTTDLPAYRVMPEHRHGVAARCLYGQPFGFTWDDVSRHRDYADRLAGPHGAAFLPPGSITEAVHQFAEWHRSMADRIAALLPPEAP